MAQPRLDTARTFPERRRRLIGAAFCLAAFGAVWLAAFAIASARALDADALAAILRAVPAHVRTTAALASHLADAGRVILMAAALVAAGVALGRRRQAAAAALILVGANLSAQAVQRLSSHDHVARAAGDPAVLFFPSGHVTAAVALWLAAMVVASARVRPVAAAAGAVYAAAIAAAVLCRGTHLPSDVLGASLLAVAWWFLGLAALGPSASRLPARHLRRALVAAIAIGTAGVVVLGAVSGAPRAVSTAHRHPGFAALLGLAAVVVGAIAAGAEVLAHRKLSRRI